MAIHSSILAWRIPRTEEPGWVQSIGSQRVRHNRGDLACTHTLKEQRVATEKGQVSFSFIKAKRDKLPYLVSHRVADKVGTENLQSCRYLNLHLHKSHLQDLLKQIPVFLPWRFRFSRLG